MLSQPLDVDILDVVFSNDDLGRKGVHWIFGLLPVIFVTELQSYLKKAVFFTLDPRANHNVNIIRKLLRHGYEVATFLSH